MLFAVVWKKLDRFPKTQNRNRKIFIEKDYKSKKVFKKVKKNNARAYWMFYCELLFVKNF